MLKKRLYVSLILLAFCAMTLLSGCGAAETGVKYYSYAPGEYVLSNLAGGSTRLFKVAIAMQMVLGEDRSEREDYLEANKSQIRDITLGLMRQLTEADIMEDPQIQEKFRERLLGALKEKLELEDLNTIFFNDFVMQ